MLLLNHASVATLPDSVPVFTVFMKMKNERSANFWVENRKKIPKINNLKYLFKDCINVCVKMFYFSPNMRNQLRQF